MLSLSIVSTSLLPCQDLALIPLAIVLACFPLRGFGLRHANRCMVCVLVPERTCRFFGLGRVCRNVVMTRARRVWHLFDRVALVDLARRVRRLKLRLVWQLRVRYG